jgi:hypothetical protein
MSLPLEICLEELGRAAEDGAFVRCVALPGGEAGLALDRDGAIRWRPEGLAAHALCVSQDDRLVLLGHADAGEIHVERGSRSVHAVPGQPVVLLDQDLLRLGERSFRVHVHGEAAEVHPPEPLTGSALARLLRAAAAAVAIGGAFAAGGDAGARPAVAGEPAPIEVRTRPPAPMPATKAIDCTITAQRPARPGGPIVVHATCPSPRGLHVGLYGSLLDPKTGQSLPGGGVKITKVTGVKIEVEASGLTKPSPAKVVRFHVRSF